MRNFFNISDSREAKAIRTERGNLSELSRGESGTIDRIENSCQGLERRRLLDLGFVPGTKVTKLGEGLFNGPSRFQIRGNVIALREEQSSLIATRS